MDAEETVLEDVVPLAGGEVADGRAVDQSRDHLGGLGSLNEGGVVVAHGDGGNLGVDIEELVAVDIDDAVARRLAQFDPDHSYRMHTSCPRSCRSRRRSRRHGSPRQNRAAWRRPWTEVRGSRPRPRTR